VFEKFLLSILGGEGPKDMHLRVLALKFGGVLFIGEFPREH
jgi:hypothetical protein